jgi:predicted dehydrogenase
LYYVHPGLARFPDHCWFVLLARHQQEDYMERLRMGVLGCSGHYFKRVAVPLRESLLVEPYAIASRDLEKAKKAAADWDFTKAYGSYEELLADPDVDFVYNPCPTTCIWSS